jgi:hypothetical protein
MHRNVIMARRVGRLVDWMAGEGLDAKRVETLANARGLAERGVAVDSRYRRRMSDNRVAVVGYRDATRRSCSALETACDLECTWSFS